MNEIPTGDSKLLQRLLALTPVGRHELQNPQSGLSLPQRWLLGRLDGQASLADLAFLRGSPSAERLPRYAAKLVDLGLAQDVGEPGPTASAFGSTTQYGEITLALPLDEPAPMSLAPHQPGPALPRKAGVPAMAAGAVLVLVAAGAAAALFSARGIAPAVAVAGVSPPSAAAGSAPISGPISVPTASPAVAASPLPQADSGNTVVAAAAAVPAPPPVRTALATPPEPLAVQPAAAALVPLRGRPAAPSPGDTTNPVRAVPVASAAPVGLPAGGRGVEPAAAQQAPVVAPAPPSVQATPQPVPAPPSLAVPPAAATPSATGGVAGVPGQAGATTVIAPAVSPSAGPPPPGPAAPTVAPPGPAAVVAAVAPAVPLRPLTVVEPAFPREGLGGGSRSVILQARMVVAANGSVTQVSFPSSALNTRPFERAARAALLQWRFPEGAGERVVQQQLRFTEE